MKFRIIGVGIALACMTTMTAHAKCKIVKFCQPGQENCEPQCFTSSDGGPGKDNMYTIDPTWAARQRAARFRAERYERNYKITHDGDYRFMQTNQYRAGAEAEGRAAWRNNGTPSAVGTISPFVPGSTQDTAWRAERKAHGIQ